MALRQSREPGGSAKPAAAARACSSETLNGKFRTKTVLGAASPDMLAVHAPAAAAEDGKRTGMPVPASASREACAPLPRRGAVRRVGRSDDVRYSAGRSSALQGASPKTPAAP